MIAIGLDAPNNDLLARWIESGDLPSLAALKRESLYGIVTHNKRFSNQNSWATFLSGIRIENIDYWLSEYSPGDYRNINKCLYNQDTFRPFYAFPDKRIVMFDLPAAISKDVNGIQVVGWASDLNEVYPESRPEDLIEEIEARYGLDPKRDGALRFFNHRVGKQGYSYRVPSAYDLAGLAEFAAKLRASAETRCRICADLLAREDWDLFITSFSELHVGGHSLWHLSQPHPLHAPGAVTDLLLELYQAVDEAIGALVAGAAPETSIVVFTVDNIVADSTENPRSVFLPELLFRWSFPGEAALAAGQAGTPVPPPTTIYPQHWKHEVWRLREPGAEAILQSPEEQEAREDTFSWQPANWYKPAWPRMRAFALPSIADGYVRINLRGREVGGLVEPADYDRTCDEIAAMLMAAVDARTDDPIVAQVIRMRADPLADSADELPADLMVCFNEVQPCDTVDHGALGRIGPVPFFRPGGHQGAGATIANPFMIRAADRSLGLRGAPGKLEDLPPTIAALLGTRLSGRQDGQSLLSRDLAECANQDQV